MPEVICSPYLDRGKSADVDGKMTIDNGIYTVKISFPRFPPEPGSIVNATDAGLKYRIGKK